MADAIEVISLIDSSSVDTDREIIELFSDDEIVNFTEKTADNPSYYQRAFNSIMSSVIEVYSVILTDTEQSILQAITCDLSISAQRLFIRLILRKTGWHRSSKLVYEEIGDVKGALEELTNKSLCDSESSDMMDYLNLLTIVELKTVASSQLFLKVAPNSSREDLVRLFLEGKSSGQQRISFTSGKLAASTWKSVGKIETLKQSTGSIVKIRDQIRQLVDTAVSLYFLVSQNGGSSSQDNFSTAILVEINRRSYPKYKIIRASPIFKCRQDYLEYQRALELEILLKDTEDQLEIIKSLEDVKINFETCLRNCDIEGSYFLRRFTAGWVYCRILCHFASSFESLKKHLEAVELYQILLNQQLFCLGYRGKWWERIVLDTSKHLKDSSKALELCESALTDPWLRTSALTSIKRRQKKLKKNEMDDFDLVDEPEIVTIKGRIKGGNTTGTKVKLHLNNDDLSLGTVEEFVLSEFSRDGWHGIHSESSCFTTLFSLLFWDLLFDLQVADVFQTAYQTAPLDLTTDAFYPLRAMELESRLKLIEDDFEGVLGLLKKHHVTYHLISCIGINWNDYSGEAGIAILVKVARGIGGMALSTILRQFCEDYRHNRSGMPDLILWRQPDAMGQKSELVDHANELIFAEVKSPNDRLSDGQRHWFSVLKSAGLRVVVVRVLDEEVISNKRLKES